MSNDKTIYVQVLLLDSKIENWKICQSKKDSPLEFKAYWKADRRDQYTMQTRVFHEEEMAVPAPWNFNSYVYNVAGPEWINQWQYADDYRLAKACVKTHDEYVREIAGIEATLTSRVPHEVKKPKYEITKVITLSTSHISVDTSALLQGVVDGPITDCGLSVYEHSDYGWMIHVPSDDTQELLDTLSDDLVAIIKLALSQDCSWVLLDCDGNVVDDLQTFEW